MPNDSTYLDELALLNQQNFLGGAATYGKAIKEKKQNETLVDLYNKFKADKNELQTTMEQTGDFNKYLTTAKVGEGEEKLPPEAGAYIDFMKSVDEMGAYTNLYQPFITAFATLGDEGVKIATTLSNELATQLEISGKKNEAVFKALEYQTLQQDLKNLKQTYTMNDFNYKVLQEKYATEKDALKVEGIVRGLSSYQSLPDITKSTTTANLNVWLKQRDAIVAETKNILKQQGLQVSDEALNAAFTKTLSDDKKITYEQPDPNAAAGTAGLVASTYDMYKSFMTSASKFYTDVHMGNPNDPRTKVIKSALQKLGQAKYDNNGNKISDTQINVEDAQQMLDDDLLTQAEFDLMFKNDGYGGKSYWEIFAPGGLYDQAQSWMIQNVPGWMNTQKDGGINVATVEPNIMRYKGSGHAGLLNGQWISSPVEIEMTKRKTTKDVNETIKDKSKQSLLGEGDTSNVFDNIMDEYQGFIKNTYLPWATGKK